MKKQITLTVVLIASMSIFAGAASAHVTVVPNETSQGKYEMFTMKVPSESEDVPTTKIEVKIPEDVLITRFEPKPGWTYEIQKDDSGKITSVIWTTEGDGLSPTEFGMFNMSGKVGDEAKEIVWKAYQTYKDGNVVEWVGAANSDKPASVTVVTPADPAADHHGEKSVSEKTAAPEASASSTNVPLYLSIAALITGLLSLVISLKKRG